VYNQQKHIAKYHKYQMTKEGKKRDSSQSLFPATDTMRADSQRAAKCFLCLLKALRLLKCTNPSKKKHTTTKSNNESSSE